MATRQPEHPSWAPEGAEWANTISVPSGRGPRRGGVGGTLLVLAVVLVPVLLVAGGAYYVWQDRRDTYTATHPGTLLNMPRNPNRGEVVFEGDLQRNLGLPSTVTSYATDPGHFLVVATRLHRYSDPQRELDRIFHAGEASKEIRRQPGDAEATVPSGGFGGVGRCLSDRRESLCIMVNKGSALLVFEVRAQTASEAARRAGLVRGTVLKRKPLVDTWW